MPQPALLIDPEHQRSTICSRSRGFGSASDDGLLLHAKRLTPFPTFDARVKWAAQTSLLRLPLIQSCSRSLCGADVFFAMPTKPVAKKPVPGKSQAVKPARKNVVQKTSAPDKAKGLRPLKETLQASLVQKKPAADKVEKLAKEYLSGLREVDVTFEKGTASRNIAPNIPNSPARYERSFLESTV